MSFFERLSLTLLVPLLAGAAPLHAQTPPPAQTQPPPPAQTQPPTKTDAPKTAPPVAAPLPPAANPAAPPPAVDAAKAEVKGVVVPPGYVIGADDVLVVVFWREKDLTSEVVVRPDGRISIPVIQDVDAAGFTPEQLRAKLTEQAQRYVEDPNVTVIVKQINSRRIYITGQVAKAGPYMLTGPMTVLQFIAMAGGLLEYADAKNILVMRSENGKQISYPFNYRDVSEGKNLQQNIDLKPGDTVVVP